MQLLVNGETQRLADGLALPELIAVLRLADRRVAVEVNGEIVPRSAWPQVCLRDGDRLEIMQAIGGG